MERILLDYYKKDKKTMWGDDPHEPYNQKILSVNNMYGWLYEQGVLREVSFRFKDYSDMSYFALDVKALVPYREQMLNSGIENADISVHHIFDEEYSPCLYCGGIQLSWPMLTYREFDGTVERSWECSMVQGLKSHVVLDVEQIKNKQGTKAAVSAAFDFYELEPDRFDLACEYYKDWVNVDDVDGDRDFLYSHAEKLIYCAENKKDLIDFDFWVQYEALIGEKITWDEYIAIDRDFDGDPHDIEPTDVATVSGFKKSLLEYRQGKDVMQTLDESIRLAKKVQDQQSNLEREGDISREER